MKVLFIGLGSIGRRHLQILDELGDFEYLSLQSGKGRYSPDFYNRFNIKTIKDFRSCADQKPAFAIIANPTAYHVKAALSLAEAGIPFLIEKPVSNRLEGLNRLCKIVAQKKIPVMVGFQLRYHPTFKKVIELIEANEIGKPLSFHGYVGQYLPGWRSEDDYRFCYSAKKDLGGGAIMDLSHEIDIAVAIMGSVNQVSCLCDKYSSLDIETEDIANITMIHHNKSISNIHLNYLERKYTWETRITGNEGSVRWDYGMGYVELIKKDGRVLRWDDPEGFERNWLFRDQLQLWLEVLKGRTSPVVDLNDGIYVTRVARAAKHSALEGKVQML